MPCGTDPEAILDKRPHVLLISQIPMWSMGRSVGGPAFQNTVHALARHYRLTVVTPALPYVDAGDFPDEVEVRTFQHHFHGAFRQVRKVGWVFDTLAWFTFRWSAWRIVRRICATDPVDLVYGYEIYGVPVARKAADRFGLPMVARYQGTLMSTRMTEHTWRQRYHKHVAALETPADLYVMTNDGTDGRRVLTELGADESRIRFWMNGVDKTIAENAPSRSNARRELGIAEDAAVVLTVSRLSGWKRVDRAIDVARSLTEDGKPVTLLVVGSGADEGRLARLADGLDVRFAGGVGRDELITYYRAADVLLSLYDYSNLANPVFEALTLGTAVVALDVGGTADLVVDGVNGRLAHSAEDVLGIVRDLLASPEAAKALGVAGAAWAADHLRTWDERMSIETEALDELLASRR